MRCLLTGTTGFVGSHLLDRLLSEGHEVTALVRRRGDSDDLKGRGVRVLEGSLDAINVFARYADSYEVVFHLAAVTNALRSREYAAINTGGTMKLIKGLRRGGFQGRFVLLSSLAAGGPAPEGEPRLESDRDEPVSRYGLSKLRAEKAVRRILPAGCTYTILRPGAIYGPREHQILELLKLVSRRGIAPRFGPPVRLQMTHVSDVVSALLRSTIPEAAGRTYYITDTPVWTFDEVIHMAAEVLRKDVRILPLPLFTASIVASLANLAGRLAGRPLVPLSPDKVLELKAGNWIANPARAEQELGWKAAVGLPEGLRSTVEWYRARKWL